MLGRSVFRSTLTLSVALALVGAAPVAITRSVLRVPLRAPTQAMQVWTWGSNNRGQLGDGTINYSNVPVKVRGLPPDIIVIAAGGSHVLALQHNGQVWAWGNNDSGQLGVTPHICRTDYGGARIPCATRPVRIPTLAHVIAISAGGDDSLALKQDGTVWNWGANGNAQLGSDSGGDATTVGTPTRITRLSHVIALATNGGNSAAVRRDGTVWAWGEESQTYGPAQVHGIGDIVAVAVGGEHFLALRRDGTVWAWGYNRYGELGVGSIDADAPHRPAPVHGLTDVVAIAAQDTESLALRRDGTVWVWGNLVTTGQNVSRPTRFGGLEHIGAIAAGDLHDAGLGQNGTMWLWGENDGGDLGQGTSGPISNPDTPHPIQQVHRIVAISLGYDSSFALQAATPHT